MNSATAAAATPIVVGVYDEPELVVHGVDGLLTRHGPAADVRAVGPGSCEDPLDVLLCDPVGRPLRIEAYLDEVAKLTPAPVLAFSWNSSPSSARRSMAAGARGFVFKGLPASELAAAVAAVSRGELLRPDPAPPRAGGSAELSAREAEVLELICRGLSNLEIADELFVSVNSVKTYVRQIYHKIGVVRRSQAVAWGLAHGF